MRSQPPLLLLPSLAPCTRRAFPNARALAKEGAGAALVEALRGHEALPQGATVALATALKQVAANDDICQEVAAAGGVQLALAILEAGGAAVGHAARVITCLDADCSVRVFPLLSALAIVLPQAWRTARWRARCARCCASW